MGVIIDIGASRKSIAGYGQFQALQAVDKSVSLDISIKGQVTVQFGIGAFTFIRTIDVNSPIGKVQFHIIKVDTSFLLCLADIDRLYIKYDNLKDIIITHTKRVPVVRQFGHPFLL